MQRDSARLQYETARVFVSVEWDPRSGELNVFLGLQARKGEPRDAFALADVLGLESVEAPEQKMPFQVADASRLGPFLTKLAEDTQIHAQPALIGDRMFFHRLKAFRNAQSQASMLGMKLRRVRSQAEEAWRNRELRKMIDLYTSIEGHLTDSEKAKLQYARKHQS